MSLRDTTIWLNNLDEGLIEERRILTEDWIKDIAFNEPQQVKILECLKNPNKDKNEVIKELLDIIKVYLELISIRPLYNHDAWKRFEKELNNILRSLSCFSLLPTLVDYAESGALKESDDDGKPLPFSTKGVLFPLHMAFNAFNHTEDQGKEFYEAIIKTCDGVRSMVKLYYTVIKPEISKGGRPLEKTERKELIRNLVSFYDKYSSAPCTIKTKGKLKINCPRRFFPFIDTCVRPIVRQLGVEWIKTPTKKKSFHDEIKRILGVKITSTK
jgi:hypothetical protein